MVLNKYTLRLFCCLLYHLFICAGVLATTNQEPANTFLQKGHIRDILFVGWNPQGDLLASYSGADATIKIWKAKEGRLIWDISTIELTYGPPVTSPDGKLVALRHGESFEIRDARSRKPIWTIAARRSGANRVTSPDGFTIAEAGRYGDACVKLFDARTNQLIGRLEGHPGIIWTVAYSPDGKIVASAGGDKSIRFWDATTGALVKTLLGHTDKVTSIAFSSDGKTLASVGDDNTLRVWNVAAGTLLRTIRGFSARLTGVNSVALSSDGRFAAVGSGTQIKVWEAATGLEFATLTTNESHTDGVPGGMQITSCCGSPVHSVMFTPDATSIVSGHKDGTIKFWDANSFQLIHTIKRENEDLRLVAISPDGGTLAAGYGGKTRVELFSLRTGKLQATVASGYDHVVSVAFSRDGTMIVTGHLATDIGVWNVTTGQLIKRLKQPFSLNDRVAFSPDGRYLVSGGENQNVMLWDIQSERLAWSAIPIDWEAEKRHEQALKKSVAVQLAEEAAEKRKIRAADNEIARWSNPVSIEFDRYEGPAGVWLRLKNNSPLPIQFSTDNLDPAKPNCGVKLSNGLTAAGLCDGAEISVQYEIEENGKPVPYGSDFSSASVLPPGAAILFSVRKDHLQNGRLVFISYSHLKENQQHKLEKYGTDRRVTFRGSQLR